MSFFKKLFGSQTADDEVIAAFADGTVVPIEEVPDQVFASKAMGEGFAIQPSNGKITAPSNGSILSVYPTGHAVCITDDFGREILMHIGIDTVNLKGKGFTVYVKDGQKVKTGDLLVEFDPEVIKENGLNDITMLVLTNSSDFSSLEMLKDGSVKAKEPVWKTVK